MKLGIWGDSNLNMTEYKMEVTETPSEEDVQVLFDGLTNSDPDDVEHVTLQRVCVFFRDQDGKIIAGMDGTTNRGWLYTKLIWVDKSAQKKGLGSKLIKKAEEIARERGCHGALVDTLSFLAVDFYKKLGYEPFGILDDFPIGHKRYYFKKRL